jgi:hypothetical protein
MKSDHLLMYWLQYRAQNFYNMGRFDRALEMNGKATEIASRLGNDECRILCAIDGYRFRFRVLEERRLKVEECMRPLMDMLEEPLNDHQRVLVLHALTLFCRDLDDRENFVRYRDETLELCRRREAEDSFFQWRKIIRELES